jgi:hypothetical protein
MILRLYCSFSLYFRKIKRKRLIFSGGVSKENPTPEKNKTKHYIVHILLVFLGFLFCTKKGKRNRSNYLTPSLKIGDFLSERNQKEQEVKDLVLFYFLAKRVC